jgi:hypothetical protein
MMMRDELSHKLFMIMNMLGWDDGRKMKWEQEQEQGQAELVLVV